MRCILLQNSEFENIADSLLRCVEDFFQVDSVIVRTFCHSSVYNFSCGAHINILCCFSPLFGGGRKIFWSWRILAFTQTSFEPSLSRSKRTHKLFWMLHFICSDSSRGWLIFRHRSGSWKLTLPAWRLGSLLCPIWPTFALFRTGHTPVGRG